MEENKIKQMKLDKGRSTVPSYYYKATLTVAEPEIIIEIPNEPISYIGYQIEEDDVSIAGTLYIKADLLGDVSKWFHIISGSVINPAISFIKFTRNNYDSEILVRVK